MHSLSELANLGVLGAESGSLRASLIRFELTRFSAALRVLNTGERRLTPQTHSQLKVGCLPFPPAADLAFTAMAPCA